MNHGPQSTSSGRLPTQTGETELASAPFVQGVPGPPPGDFKFTERVVLQAGQCEGTVSDKAPLPSQA